ncbi:hypothetical protein [Mycobacterium shimoidei]|nr:hypothetical protein [Mycobacterium shimoidei]
MSTVSPKRCHQRAKALIDIKVLGMAAARTKIVDRETAANT